MVKGSPPCGQNAVHQVVIPGIYCEEEMARCSLYTNSQAMVSDLAGWSGTWKKHDWRIDGKEIDQKEEVNEQNHINGQKIEDICEPYESSPKGDLSRGRF